MTPTVTPAVIDLKLHSKDNCVPIAPDAMREMEQSAASQVLQPGTYTVRIQEGAFGDRTEPVVLLWLYGGRLINQDTGVEVNATWCSLNGYDDHLTLTVLTSTTLTAFVGDMSGSQNEAEPMLVITRH